MVDRTKKPKVVLPDDYETEDAFLADMRQSFNDDVNYDKLNREAAIEDIKFLIGEQWDDIVRQRRESARKPVLTINRMPAFVAQVVGSRRLNETTIKILPDNGGTKDVAKVREGLVRNILKVSKADRAFNKALENQVGCGIGNFMLDLEYESDDVFEQAIKLKELPDAMSVVWDYELVEPTGADAGHCFVEQSMAMRVFKNRWPWAVPSEISIDTTLRADLRMNGWISTETARVVNYYRMRTSVRTLALMNDGKTLDVTDEEDESKLANVVTRPDGTPMMREVDRKYCQLYVCSGKDILEGPYNLPISRVPVYRVPGWEMNVGQWKHRWGVIRHAKDPQRLHNYWRSVLAERLSQSPRAVWVATDTAVQGREKQWRESHLSDDPLLIYNAEGGAKPERMDPMQLESALLEQSEITNQDIKDVTNIHEANLGMPSNEVSGAAILARQRVSDTGTILYHDNLTLAIEECGRTINELIPFVYDTPRIVKVLGADAREEMQIINDENDPRSIDITTGKYNVTVATGPSFATKRIEAQQNMMNLINALPQVAQYIPDLVVESQDWPMADRIAKRLRRTLPPQILGPEDMDPELQQHVEQAGQAAAEQKKTQDAVVAAKMEESASSTAVNYARAHNFMVNAENETSRTQNESLDVASQAADRELRGRLEAINTAHSTK